VTTDSKHGLAVADNLLGQKFEATAHGQVWVTDITYIPTDEGWLYLAGHKEQGSIPQIDEQFRNLTLLRKIRRVKTFEVFQKTGSKPGLNRVAVQKIKLANIVTR
jgi:hypothetical protein